MVNRRFTPPPYVSTFARPAHAFHHCIRFRYHYMFPPFVSRFRHLFSFHHYVFSSFSPIHVSSCLLSSLSILRLFSSTTTFPLSLFLLATSFLPPLRFIPPLVFYLFSSTTVPSTSCLLPLFFHHCVSSTPCLLPLSFHHSVFCYVSASFLFPTGTPSSLRIISLSLSHCTLSAHPNHPVDRPPPSLHGRSMVVM